LNIENEAISILTKEIIKMINTIVDKAKYDRTVKGKIIALPDKTNSKYIVMIDGNEYNAVSCVNGLSVNDIVYIKIAENNYNNLLIECILK